MASQQQASKTPLNERDSYSTPQYVFDWINHKFNFVVDLAASSENKKCARCLTLESNSLTKDWAALYGRGMYGWCNPPYSNIKPWLLKGWQESRKGFGSVFLVPTPNGEEVFRDCVFGRASDVILISGRISFIDATGKPKGGNTRGSCFVIYRPYWDLGTAFTYVDREEMKRFSEKGNE